MEINKNIVLWKALVSEKKDTIEIEKYFSDYIQNNTKFSLEYLFNLIEIEKHVCSVHFIPTSSAYNHIGETICITNIICTDEEYKCFIKSVAMEQNSFGIIKAKTLDETSDDIKQFLKNVGFSVKEIYEIEWL